MNEERRTLDIMQTYPFAVGIPARLPGIHHPLHLISCTQLHKSHFYQLVVHIQLFYYGCVGLYDILFTLSISLFGLYDIQFTLSISLFGFYSILFTLSVSLFGLYSILFTLSISLFGLYNILIILFVSLQFQIPLCL